MTRSQARARPKPPAMAQPWTRAIVGLPSVHISSNSCGQPSPGQVVVEVLVRCPARVLRDHARQIGAGTECLVARTRRAPPPAPPGRPWPGPARGAVPAMTSQVMALRRSGRLMVRVRTGPSRTASRSAEARKVGGAVASGTPRRYRRDGGHRRAVATGGATPRYGVAIATAALLSFRLGGTDGVAIEAAKWRHALEELGHATYTVAGTGPVDVTVPGLAIGAEEGPAPRGDRRCPGPGRPGGGGEPLLAAAQSSRPGTWSPPHWPVGPAVLHHHDLPWQRAQFVDHPGPPTTRVGATSPSTR